jgi:hypothetical protein
MRRFRGYETSEIGNMDETPVWFQMPGKSTLAESGEKEVRVATTGQFIVNFLIADRFTPTW